MEGLFKLIKNDIDDRKVWEERQATAYKLRFNQVRRRLRPYPHAADYSWPLIDTAIDKIKPAYIEQIFGPEFIANFAAKNKVGEGFVIAVSQWFDWRVKKRSNFEKQAHILIDTMCQNGSGFLKTMWDPTKKQTRHESIYPTNVVFPIYTEELSEADRVAHVMLISKQRYLRVGETYGYNMDEEFVRTICGKPTETSYQEAKELREGLGWHSKNDIIVLWEVYEKTASNQIKVHTFSPMHPNEQVRDPFTLPYQHNKIPIVQYFFEITDGGVYSPRGVAETIQLYQQLLKTLLDMDMDYVFQCNRPVWMPAEGAPATNYQNFGLAPGQVINARLQPLQFPTPPLDFMERQQNIRAIAQERIMTSDYGIGDQSNSGQGKKTAREVSELGAVKESGVNLKSRIADMSINQTLQMTWSLELQFRGDDLDYFYKRQFKTLDDAALEHVYELEAAGGKDGFSRDKLLQKYVQIYNMFRGQPFFKDPAMAKKIFEVTDPDLINSVFEELQIENANQILKQYDETQAMVNGAQVPVSPEDHDQDHVTAIEAQINYFKSHPDKMLMPDVQIRVITHEDQHLAQWKQKDPRGYAQNLMMIKQIMARNKQIAQGLAQMAQQQLQAAQGGQVPGQPPGAPAGPIPGPQNGTSPVAQPVPSVSQPL